MFWRFALIICLTKHTHEMNKVFSLLLPFVTSLFVFTSCSNVDGYEYEDNPILTSTYTVLYSSANPPDGVEIEVTVFEYNDKDEAIHQSHMKNVRLGSTRKFTAKPNAQKLKVYLETSSESQSDFFWIQQVYYLEPGNNILIDITDDIRVGKVEP